MEKPKVLNGTKIEPYRNKEKFADKLDSLWNTNSSQEGKLKNQTKKLIIKLQSIGKETRKISLKLESSNSNLSHNNYNLLSELLKEFFSVDNNSS